MDAKKRVVMVVEDDRILNNTYAELCRMALAQLAEEGLPLTIDEASVQSAYTYDQARLILDDGVDLVSVDLALGSAEYGLTDRDRRDRDAGGMRLLDELHAAPGTPLAIVVSGETLQSYAIDALGEHGVLGFYQKARLDLGQYVGAVKAALWYRHAADLIAEVQATHAHYDNIRAAEQGWKKALQAADEAGIRPRSFPLDLGLRLETLRAHLLHPFTALPFGPWTADRLRRALRRGDWAVAEMRIKGFNAFVSTHASQEAGILVSAAQHLQEACAGKPDDEIFVGHLEHAGQQLDPSFVIVARGREAQAVAQIAADAAAGFNETAHLFAAHGAAFEETTSPVWAQTRVVTSQDMDRGANFHELLDILASPID